MDRILFAALAMMIGISSGASFPPRNELAATATSIHVFGDPYAKDGNTVEIYTPFKEQAKDSIQIIYNETIGCQGIAKIDSKVLLYASGQTGPYKVFTYCSDCNPKQLKSPLDIPGDRQYGASAVLSGAFCICGGHYDSPSATCTCLDPKTSSWSSIPNMQTGRILFAMASLNGGKSIYAIGGVTEGKKMLSSVEKFTVGTTRWESVKSMNHIRNDHDAVAYDDKTIYVCGDGFMHPQGKSCERYDADTNKWTDIASTNAIHMDFALVKFNDNIFTLGSGQPEAEEDVEYYEPSKDKWATTYKLRELRNWVCGIAM